MHGITLTKFPEDWEIIQQEDGYAKVQLAGHYNVHKAALEVGVERAVPVVRVVQEEDNQIVVPWTVADEIIEDEIIEDEIIEDEIIEDEIIEDEIIEDEIIEDEIIEDEIIEDEIIEDEIIEDEIIEDEIIEDENFTGTFITEITVPAGGLYRIETSLKTKSTVENLMWYYRGDCILHLGVGDLFIIAGQSNAAGYSRDYTKDAPQLGVHLFRNRGKWDIASHPMNESTFGGSLPNEEMGISGASPYLAFGKDLYAYTHMPVGFIQTSLGGSEIARWKPNSAGGDLYQNLIERVHLTKKKYKAVLWYQGCSDATPEKASSYYDNFKELVLAFRKELGYEIPFFTFQLNRQLNGLSDEGFGLVREAQRKAAEKIPEVYVLPTSNCSLCDAIHNTAQANVVLGKKLAKQYIGAKLSGPSWNAPDVVAVTRAKMQGDWLRLTYKNIVGNLLLFSSEGEHSGFTLHDEEGAICIQKIIIDKDVFLQLDRAPTQHITLSFAWEAYPVVQPFVDEVTWLPPLSFYQRKFIIE